jgi:CrcB protein
MNGEFMRSYFLVAIGAACGGTLRYWITGLVQRLVPFGLPLGTLTVNVLGSFALGFLIFYFDTLELLPPPAKLILTVGFCGGFTTFSTFSFETINLLRDSEYFMAIVNIGLNVFLTLAAVVLSYYAAKTLNGA